MTADGGAGDASDGAAGLSAESGGGARDPSDAFGALGGDHRLAVVRALDDDEPRSFSELFDATDVDTSAGFAYHLRQLTGRFVRQRDDERYELTDAGRSAARALRAGTYTDSVDCGPVELEEDCPLCAEPGLVVTVEDNVTEVGCEGCDAALLRLSLPPSGYVDREIDDLPAAIDAHHRRRIQSFGGGVCPECAGSASARIEPAVDDGRGSNDRRCPDDDPGTDGSADGRVPVQAVFECETCGADLRCPVALTLLDHPAVVSFYHDHALDVRDRPIWNVGSEWRERVVSRDPWCVVVSVRLGGDDLFLYVAGDCRVVDHRRDPGDDGPSAGPDAECEAATVTDPADAAAEDDATIAPEDASAESDAAES